MLKRAFIIALSTILLTNCTSWRNVADTSISEIATKSTSAKQYIAKLWFKKKPNATQSMPQMLAYTSIPQYTEPFSKVKITGKIDVYLHTGTRFNKIVFHGAEEDIKNTDRNVKNGFLNINLDKKLPKYGYMKVDIYTPKLTSFTYHGSGNIFAKGVTSICTDIEIDTDKSATFEGSFGLGRAKFSNVGYYKISGIRGCETNLILMDNAKVNLTGYSNVANLNMGGNSTLNLYWVKSHTIHIKLKDNACAQLSGVANILNSEQWDRSHLDSRYLIAQTSFVKTHDYSVANISVIKNQHTLAKDKSNIYYYSLPENKTDFMAKDGSVLDMREWGSAY